MTEIELIKACVRHDRMAQELLFKKYGSSLRYLCMRYAPTSAEVDDILQESFVKIFQNIGKYQSNGSFEGWMKRICINTAIDYFKKNKRATNSSNILEEQIGEDEYQADSWETMADVLSQQELLDIVNILPTGYKLVFNLYAIENYTHKQISQMLEIAEGTSKSQLAKAKKMLKEKVIAAALEHTRKVIQLNHNVGKASPESNNEKSNKYLL